MTVTAALLLYVVAVLSIGPKLLARITAVLASVEINVATIRTSRRERGETAVTAVEIDGVLLPEVPALLAKSRLVARLVVLPVLPGF